MRIKGDVHKAESKSIASHFTDSLMFARLKALNCNILGLLLHHTFTHFLVITGALVLVGDEKANRGAESNAWGCCKGAGECATCEMKGKKKRRYADVGLYIRHKLKIEAHSCSANHAWEVLVADLMTDRYASQI